MNEADTRGLREGLLCASLNLTRPWFRHLSSFNPFFSGTYLTGPKSIIMAIYFLLLDSR